MVNYNNIVPNNCWHDHLASLKPCFGSIGYVSDLQVCFWFILIERNGIFSQWYNGVSLPSEFRSKVFFYTFGNCLTGTPLYFWLNSLVWCIISNSFVSMPYLFIKRHLIKLYFLLQTSWRRDSELEARSQWKVLRCGISYTQWCRPTNPCGVHLHTADITGEICC